MDDGSRATSTPLQQDSPFKLPGFNLPLNFKPQPYPGEDKKWSTRTKLFPSALTDVERSEDRMGFLPMTTLREFTMVRLMNHITDKPNWQEKVWKKKVVQKWREEVLANKDPNTDVTEAMVDFMIEELRDKTQLYHELGAVIAYDADVVKSDIAVSETLKNELQEAVRNLEGRSEKDFHPGSNNLVNDLIHPSMFPVVYGHTRILPDELMDLEGCILKCGEGTVLPTPDQPPVMNMRPGYLGYRDQISPYSRQFQWLPCNVELTAFKEAKIASYINNLHPRETALYSVIERVITCAIPLWGLSLTRLDSRFVNDRPLRINFHGVHYGELPEGIQIPEQRPGEYDSRYDRRIEAWRNKVTVKKPEPGKFVSHYSYANYLDLGHYYSRLQVIVKLANIELTPESPEYEGGSWHVEGQLNEHICATAIYYYDSHNITDSRLAFRQDSAWKFGDFYGGNIDEHDWVEPIFGGSQNESTVQDVGDVLCKEGRLITFPNVLQHRVMPFSLLDRTRPGHRKILALFLVDPNIQIISTANVPPQQPDWAEQGGTEGRNPGMSLAEAQRFRLDLMNERSVFVDKQTTEFHGTYWNLCEH